MTYPLLERIEGPADLKALCESQLPQLAQEMRNYLIETLAPIGGHLGSGLGVVELTIALHYLFDSPRDKIIWDVGHQAYPHKILTGRLSRMPSIRQHGGLSGFTNSSESAHDPFGAGHASTSISAAFGMATGRDLNDEHHHVVAVIGDAALSGGMAFEALNHAGAHNNRMLVILNDNEMSIAPNVGAMSSYLARIITGKPYTQAREAAKRILELLPGALDAAKRVEEHVKGMIVPGTLFEEMGFRYIGPVDGHDFDHLLPTLANCRELEGPILLHILTKKGLGFSPAENDPETWHGLGPYSVQTGQPHKSNGSPPSFTRVFAEALTDLADNDERIIAITAAMSAGTGVSHFAKHHPERHFDVGIAEEHAVTFAGGLAAAGKRPFVAIYSTFMQRAYDQIIHDICIQNLPVTFCMDRAGIVGADGATHTGMFDIAFMHNLPNMTVMAPKDEAELRHMLLTALSINGPVAIRYPRGNGYGVELGAMHALAAGRAEILEEGDAGLVIAVGTRVRDSLQAVEILRKEDGRAFSLLNLRFIKPLDERAILSHLQADKPLVVVEEGVARGGIGEHIAVVALQSGWRGPFVHIAIPDVFPAHGTQAEILHDLELDTVGIVKQLRNC